MIGIIPQMVVFRKTTNERLPEAAASEECDGMGTDSSYQFADLGARLKRLRESQKLSQKQWSERHGFNLTQYNNWERGERRIPLEHAERLSDAYGLTLDFIYRGRLDGLSEYARKSL